MKATLDTSEITRLMDKIQNGLSDMSAPLESTGKELIEVIGDENFEKQGATLDAPWAPHSVWTLQGRARRYGHYANTPIETQKILIWTGALKRGFQKAVDRTTLTIENNVEYFKYLIGKRKMLGINSKVIKVIEENFFQWLLKIIK